MMKVEMFNGAELEVGEEIRFADLWHTEDEENPVNTLVKITDIR